MYPYVHLSRINVYQNENAMTDANTMYLLHRNPSLEPSIKSKSTIGEIHSKPRECILLILREETQGQISSLLSSLFLSFLFYLDCLVSVSLRTYVIPFNSEPSYDDVSMILKVVKCIHVFNLKSERSYDFKIILSWTLILTLRDSRKTFKSVKWIYD